MPQRLRQEGEKAPVVEEELLELEDLDLVEGHLRCVGKARQAPEVMADPVERHAVGVVRLEEGEGRVGLVVALFQGALPGDRDHPRLRVPSERGIRQEAPPEGVRARVGPGVPAHAATAQGFGRSRAATSRSCRPTQLFRPDVPERGDDAEETEAPSHAA